eukprot:gene6160-9203_t
MSIATLCFCTLHNKRHLRGSIVSGVCLPAVLVPAFMTLLLVLLTVETAQMYHIHDPDADHTRQGLLHIENGSMEQGLRSFRAAVRFTPSAGSYSNLGVCLMRRSEFISARRVLLKALQLDPQHPLAVDNIREVEEFLRKEGMLSEENHPIQPHDGHRKFEDDTTDISLEEIEIVLSTVPISQVPTLAEVERMPVPLNSDLEPIFATRETIIVLTDRTSVFNFIAGDKFRNEYFEAFPLLIHTDDAFRDTVRNEDIFEGEPYLYLGNKEDPPFRNVKYLKGSFYPNETVGWQDGDKMLKALGGGFTLQFYSIQNWLKHPAKLCVDLSRAIALPVNINLYVTPPGQAVSLIPHTDYQCSLMIQLRGQKRWRLWVREELRIPVRSHHIRGRDGDDPL